MRRFNIKRLNEDLTSHSGLALVGQALLHSGLCEAADRAVSHHHGVSHGDVLSSYIGLLSLGKHDYEAIGGLRKDPFFREAIGLRKVPSSATIRLRFDKHAEQLLPLVRDSAVQVLRGVKAKPTPLDTGHVPLDADVTPFDNSQTRKEGVSRTYHGYDGYAPMAAYLGREGYCLEFELRKGVQHCQRGTPEFLARVLGRARQLTAKPVLVRLDAGNDAIDNMEVVFDHREAGGKADFLIKWNPRRKDVGKKWLHYAERQRVRFDRPRKGKRVAVFTVSETRRHRGRDYALRRVMRVTERKSTAGGQLLLEPKITVEGWWTTLDLDDQRVIDLYADHGTSEQFHSEFKTDLGVERLPSQKFATNALVLACATVAYNILRWLGQKGLVAPGGPVRHPAERRRIRTVIQELMYLAARVIESGRRLSLGFGRRCQAVEVFSKLYARLAPT